MKNLAVLGLSLAFFLVSNFAFANTGIIRGTVYEQSTGEPLFGVAVRIQNTATGAVTDFDGKFQIKVEPGTYTLEATFVSFKTVTITDLVVDDDVTIIDAIWMEDAVEELEAIVVKAEVIKNSETALLTVKRKSANVLDGISAESFRKIGDADAGAAAKRVTGVSVEGGKYVYVRGLGDRYTKTTLNGLDIPGLDPDRNSLQIDIFPTNLIDNLTIVKTFTPDLPADFTGGIVNIETKDFPEEKVFSVSTSLTYNPSMHFNSDYLTYEGGNTDFLGFDDGTRVLPADARGIDIPDPFGSSDQEVSSFLGQFGPTMGTEQATSPMDFSLGITAADQMLLNNGHSLGYMFTANYKNTTTLYDDAFFGEYQNDIDPTVLDFQRALTQEGLISENNVLLGAMGGLAYKTSNSKYKFNVMHLQNGESRAAEFDIIDDDGAVGKSGFVGFSDNLEYNERAITNFFLNGEHHINDDKWEVDWRGSANFSSQEDPDIRKTPFTTLNNGPSFGAGAAGVPTRLWRDLNEVNISGKVDLTNQYKAFGNDAKLKFGASHTYKQRDYEIVQLNMNFFGAQPSWTGEALDVWMEDNLAPNGPIYLSSGTSEPNPNAYESDINNTGFYLMTELSISDKLKTVVGVRAENFVQRHTGRDQTAAATIRTSLSDGTMTEAEVIEMVKSDPDRFGNVLDDDKVLDALDWFPSLNFIYELREKQNLRLSYSKTIARPSFKELSFAQILDPVSNRFFDGGLFPIDDWDGGLRESRIDNLDLRWEVFMNRGQLISISAFYKSFDNPIELVQLPQQQTNAEFQPRNVGDGRVIGLEIEFRKALDFISPNFSVNGNLTLVESAIDMSATELRNRRNNAREEATIDDTRNMAGQAPWIVNAGLAYNSPEKGIDLGLFYNVKGRTLVVVGGGIGPDVFAEPFHSLNFNLNKSFGQQERWTFNFSVSNILGDKLEQNYRRAFTSSDDTANPELFQRFSPGTAVGVGASFSF